ncbi:MAG: ABC transporter ATP-binding protein/permease [Actinomycetota bacterium]|nr:ABC transporter ATP-binding protein/permease [Actinomycetota bacterium]
MQEQGRPTGWVRRLRPYLGAHRRDVIVAFGASLAGLTVTALTPLVQKVILDDVVTAGRRSLGPWLALLVAAGVFRFGAAHLRRYVGGRVALAVQHDLRNAVYEHLQRLDFARHDEAQTGQLVSRASSDVALVQGLLAFLPLTTGNVLLLVLSLVIMVVLSPLLTVIALVAVPALVLLARRLRTSVFPASWDAQQKAAGVVGVIDEAVTGVRVVKGFGQEAQELERLSQASASLYGSRVRAARIEARFAASFQVVPALSQVAVLALGGWLALRGRISLGTFLAFSTYVGQLVSPVRMLSSLLVVAQQARAGAERIFDILDSNPAVSERPDAVDLPPLRGEVVFDGVTFGYLRSERVLEGFSLTVAAGETVALVGASGSGKSTVAMLLPRFYDVADGAVRVDGVDVRDATFESLRRQIGVVFEETFLFTDTVRANIAYGRPDATDDEVRAAARAAEADAFIAALPDGYDTLLGERGLTLSGGQRQRIALARALLTDPAILVLDDATSSVDSRVEEEIHATLRRLAEGRTTLLVAHRRSTLRLADRIAVMDAGRVLDIGTHDQLMARCALYRQLLAGPGESCEEPAAMGDERLDGTTPLDGVTASAWARPAGGEGAGVWSPSRLATSTHGGELFLGHGMGRGPGQGGAHGGVAERAAMLDPTPGLLEAVAALPPTTEQAELARSVPVAAAALPGGRERAPFTLRRMVRPYRRQLALGLGLVVLDTSATIVGPALVGFGVDRGVVEASGRTLALASLAYLAVVVANGCNVWAEQRQTRRTAERLLFDLRVRMFAHLQSLGLDYYDREAAGRIMTRMTTDVEALSTLLQNGLITAVVSILSFGGVAVVLLVMNVALSLATFVVLFPLVLATIWFRRRSAQAYDTARERIATVNANLQESISGVRVAQAYGREDRNIGHFRGVAQRYFDARMTAQRLVATYFPFVELLSEVAAAVVLGVGAHLAARGSLSPGELIAFLLYLNQLFSPIQQLSHVFDTYQQARASTAKIGELLATPTSTPVAHQPIDPGVVRGSIRFEGVHFRYPGTPAEALAGVDLEVSPRQTVALVGETGAGKSTIVKLVARFYDPTEGRVLIDGVPLTALDTDAYRRQLGYVPQEAFLFSGTIRDNIAYGRSAATDAEVEAAAAAVGAHELVASLPGGYLHVVSERGRSLSAGQRQLIALARARLVDPAILLLDEATSNLDLVTEAHVTHAMSVVAEGRTTLIIAHRLPTARSADRIVVVDGGRVVEEGTHTELVAQPGGHYAHLWRAFEVEPQAV